MANAMFEVNDTVLVHGPSDDEGRMIFPPCSEKYVGNTDTIVEKTEYQNHWFYLTKSSSFNRDYFREDFLRTPGPQFLLRQYFTFGLKALNEKRITQAEFKELCAFYAKRYSEKDPGDSIGFDNHSSAWIPKKDLFECVDCHKAYVNSVRTLCSAEKAHCPTCFKNLYVKCHCGCFSSHKDDKHWGLAYLRGGAISGRYYMPKHKNEFYHLGDKYFVRQKIPAYHAGHRPWEDKHNIGELYGVELEVWCEDRSMIYDQLPLEAGYIGENDSSLCPNHGLEIVGPPVSLEEYQDIGSNWKKILDTVRQNGGKSWNEGSNYGMHVNVNRKQFRNPDHAANFVLFFDDNKKFCEEIAGRKEDDVEGARGHKPFTYGNRKPSPEATAAQILQQPNKYVAVNVLGKRLEVRIFRGTIKWTSFVKNVEFCSAVWKFTSEAPNKPLKEFLQFVRAQAAQRQYVHLDKFLESKELYKCIYTCSYTESSAGGILRMRAWNDMLPISAMRSRSPTICYLAGGVLS